MAVISDIEIRLRADIARLQNDMNAARRSVDGAMGGITRAVSAARNAFIGLAAGIGLGELANLTDQYTKFTAQLKLATNSQQEYARAIEDVKRISTSAQNDIGATGVLYARIIASTRDLGVAQSQVAKVTETVNLALAATGAGSGEAASAMLQLSQAFGSGVLRGEEFNAVYEAAPELLRILARDMDIPIGKLRKLAEAGALTSDKLVKAFSNDKVIEGLRENVAQITTISGAFTVFKNNLIEIIGTQAHASGAVKIITTAILGAADAVRVLAGVLGPALKIGAAYIAAFVVAPAVFQFAATAMGNLRLQIALAKLEMASGTPIATIFSTAIGGVGISAQWASGMLGKLAIASSVAFAAFVGWEIGKYIESQFVEVEIAAEVMTGELLKAWQVIKFAFKDAFDAITLTAREGIALLTRGMAGWFGFVADGMRMIGKSDAAEGIDKFAASIVKATEVEGTFAGRSAQRRAEFEKEIKLIDLDTDRRSTNALMRGTLAEAADRATTTTVKAVVEQTKATKAQISAYATLIEALELRVMETAREAAGLGELTKAEKAHIELTNDIKNKKLLLTKAEESRARSLINEAGANDVLIKSNKEWADLQAQLADNAKDLASERMSLIESARQEAEQNELAIETYGMSEAAIIRLTASRLLDQEAQRLGRTLTADEIADLQRVIDLKERSAKAVANKAELEATKAFWTDIEKTAHDTFVSIADGGKNAFQRLKDTAKNTFFDWLYQQTLKKWIINIGTSVTGAGVAGAAQAAGGGVGSISGIPSLIGSVKGIGSGALQTAGAVLTGQAGLGSTIGAGFSALASGTASGITAGLSSLAGTLGPIALGIAGAAKLLSSAFGRGPKELTGNSKLTGSLTAAEFAGSFQDEWKKKGGWFSSSKTGFDTRAVDSAVAQSLGATYQAITSTSADYARMLGLNADAIANRTQSISIAMGKDEAANQKAIADFFTGVANTVAGELLPEIGKFQMAGEEASATLQRLATNYAGLDQVLAIMGSTSQKAFGAVGVASIEARERLIAFAGGLDAIASQTTFFNQNFLSQAEQIAIVQKPLNEALANLGYAGITTADQFKAAVLGLSESGALATTEGAKTYAGLLALAPAFKTVSDYLKEVSDAAAETAKDLEQVALAERERAEAAIQAAKEAALAQLEANEQVLRGLVDTALGAVQRAVEAQKNIVTKAYNDSMTVLQARISSVGESISKITELSTLLKNSLGTVSSDAQQGASRAAARAQITTALAIAKASGVLPSADSLKDALSTINSDASDQFSSLVDYQREVARTNAEISALGGLTDKQLTEAQMQLKLLEDTKALAERQYQDEISRLDGILEWAQAQVDAINKVDNSVLSVVAAIATLNVAIQGLSQGATPSNPGGGPLSVDQLYKTVLGRDGDAAGVEFWKKAFGDAVDANEYAQFIQGAQPELDMLDRQKRQMESVATMPGSGTISSSAANPNQEAFNQRMEAMAAQQTAAMQQLASQFNQVSGGGNSLLTEPA